MVHLHITEDEQNWLRYIVRSGMLYHYDVAEDQRLGKIMLDKIEYARNPAKETQQTRITEEDHTWR